ncbi:UNVERIFIED_ORG: UDP-glucose 6-dehydrogenase [Bacillus sp. 1751]|nr:UDP-glucose 6-dehydrogenase [Bacillus sp. 1751]
MERLHFTTDYQAAYKGTDVIFIGVGTLVKSDYSVKLSCVYGVAEQIVSSIEKD